MRDHSLSCGMRHVLAHHVVDDQGTPVDDGVFDCGVTQVDEGKVPGVRKDAFAGDSARLTLVYKPINTVGMPSTIKSHCQPAKPSQPSSASRPAAKGAPITWSPMLKLVLVQQNSAAV
ncbi:MAG: hypothetical protein FRX49_07740 [Trebouxia sp. A1-2]|nr:MAG: hypothetical protein FRX49_07740 [Trebouxia sp. A1-2]